MREPDLALQIIEAVAAAVAIPVTVKMRLGWDGATMNAPDIARAAQSAGAAMIVVHGRTRSQFYKGQADWAAIAPTVAAVSIPVIANGDIVCPASAQAALSQSGAAGVMIGRGAQGQAWAPAAIATFLQTGAMPAPPSFQVILESILELYEDSLSFYGAALGARIARKHIAWTIEANAIHLSQQDRRNARAALCAANDPRTVREGLRALFLQQEELAA